eukprot:scaffold237501_cov12-Tisochrysis_lutea.AAC.1
MKSAGRPHAAWPGPPSSSCLKAGFQGHKENRNLAINIAVSLEVQCHGIQAVPLACHLELCFS